MAIHMYEETVTRQDRRRIARAKETIDTAAKRDKTRAKMVRDHFEKQGIPFSDEMATKKAFVEALEWKRGNRSVSKADMKLAEELRAVTEHNVHLARKVRNHILMSRKGVMWGESLKDIYREIGEVLNETADDIENAVDIAESMKLLRRHEADDASTTEWVYVDLSAA